MTTYTTVQGDLWDVISLKAYGDEGRCGALIEANPAHVDTVIFSARVVLNVPPAPPPSVVDNLPPWRTVEEVS